MRRTFPHILAGLIVALNLSAWAAVPDLSEIPPPHAPFVAELPKDGQWVITISPEVKPKPKGASEAEAEASPPPFQGGPSGVVEIRVVKTGKAKRDTLVFKSRPSKDFWFVGNYILMLRSNQKDYAIFDAGALVLPVDVKGVYREIGSLTSSKKFAGMDWLQMKYYDGVVLLDKTLPCYHYILKGIDPDTKLQVVVAEAWVDAETSMPVRYSSNGNVYTYKFGPPPTEALVIPPPYTNILDK